MIHFYDKHRTLVMTLERTQIKQDVVPIWEFDIKIAYKYFSASLTVGDLCGSFETFKNELSDFYNGKRCSANITLIERELEICFYKENEQMICKIQSNHFEMDNTMCHSSLIINYEMDKSFLPELINEFDEEISTNDLIV